MRYNEISAAGRSTGTKGVFMTSRNHQAKRSLLLVDDDAGMRALLTEIFSAAGFTALTAASGEEALELAASDKPALVVLDVNLPGCSGYEVCSRLRQKFGPTIGIVFLSGERTESLRPRRGPDDRRRRLPRQAGRGRRAARPAPVSAPPGRTRLRDVDADPARAARCFGCSRRGSAQAEIAERLVISPKTVGSHIERVLSKLGAHSRAEAVALAYRLGVVLRSATRLTTVSCRSR